jgi:hypothetical protein
VPITSLMQPVDGGKGSVGMARGYCSFWRTINPCVGGAGASRCGCCSRRRRREPRIGTGPGAWGACFLWSWPRVFRHCVGGGKRADALRRHSRTRPGALPFCRRGALRIIAAAPQESVSTRLLRHCKLASVPPPDCPGLLSPRNVRLGYLSPRRRVGSGVTCAQRRCSSPL